MIFYTTSDGLVLTFPYIGILLLILPPKLFIPAWFQWMLMLVYVLPTTNVVCYAIDEVVLTCGKSSSYTAPVPRPSTSGSTNYCVYLCLAGYSAWAKLMQQMIALT